MTKSDAFLGRQPIFDRRRRIVAYELLFRTDRQESEIHVSDNAAATAHVVQLAFRQFGINTVVGSARAFINVDAEFLASDLLETLPQDRVVLEILETVNVDERVSDRCRQLRARGYRIALDDFLYREDYEQLLDIVDIVKLDLLKIDSRSLSNVVERLKLRRITLLAEKVESMERLRQCCSLGIELFQGFLLASPTVLHG